MGLIFGFPGLIYEEVLGQYYPASPLLETIPRTQKHDSKL
jgi:hypothetical protein